MRPRRTSRPATLLLAASLAFASAALGTPSATHAGPRGGRLKLALTSPAFEPGAEIPTEHTCEGPDRSPPLRWTGAPAKAKSFALVVIDPDVPDPEKPTRNWVHWVLYNLPAGTTALPAAMTHEGLPPGALQGRNDWGKNKWQGPCPPIGRHRYFFKLYALDTILDVRQPDLVDLENAMEKHTLATVELMGTYEKKKLKKSK